MNADLMLVDQQWTWRQNQAPGAVVVRTSYLDNPWLPEVLQVEADYLEATDPKGFLHIWGGQCQSATEGAIYAEELKAAPNPPDTFSHVHAR